MENDTGDDYLGKYGGRGTGDDVCDGMLSAGDGPGVGNDWELKVGTHKRFGQCARSSQSVVVGGDTHDIMSAWETTLRKVPRGVPGTVGMWRKPREVA